MPCGRDAGQSRHHQSHRAGRPCAAGRGLGAGTRAALIRLAEHRFRCAGPYEQKGAAVHRALSFPYTRSSASVPLVLSKTTRSATGNRCADGDAAQRSGPGTPALGASFSMLGGTRADRSEDEGSNVPAGSHSKGAASDCPCATPASAARQRTGTSFSSDHLADASSRGDGRLSGQKRSGGSSARSPALPTH